MIINIKSHLTAKSRVSPSKPMQILNDKKLLIGRMLDYGCGRGFDAKHFEMESYDIYYNPTMPTGKFNTITCNYVLNVIDNNETIKEILSKLKGLLKKDGTCYITVRRDVLVDGFTSKGTFQRNIKLELPILKENKLYCIYILK